MTPCYIYVAGGTYEENLQFKKRFHIVEGGYNPDTWERDRVGYPTILDGKRVRSVLSTDQDPTLEGNVFDGFTLQNEENDFGTGGGLYSLLDELDIVDCEFIQNRATLAAGAHVTNAAVVTGSLFRGNTSETETGGLRADPDYLNGDRGRIVNCAFVSNARAGIYLRNQGSSVEIPWEIRNCSIIGNSAVGLGSGLVLDRSRVAVFNSIFAYNQPYGIHERIAMDYEDLKNNCFFDNGTAAIRDDNLIDVSGFVPMNTLANALDNITRDPAVWDPVGGDFHLMSGSGAIDAGRNEGAPATDIDGEDRPRGDTVDIGADEYNPSYTPTMPTPTPTITPTPTPVTPTPYPILPPACLDRNGNGIFDGPDLVDIMQYWHQPVR